MSLEDIREKKTSKAVYVVIGFLLVGMAGFGTSQFGTGNNVSQDALMSTKDAEITTLQYETALRNVQQSNPDMPLAEMRSAVLGGLRQQLAVADYVQRYPLAAANAQIDSAIVNNIYFSENGKFSEAAFRSAIGVSPEIYRRDVSNDIAAKMLQAAVAGTAVVSRAEVKPYLELRNMSRDIRVAKITRSLFNNTADDAEIQSYYDANKSDYMTSETLDIDYIDFNPADIAKTIELSDSEQNDLATPPRQADYIIFTDINQAQAAYDAVKAGASVDSIKTDFVDAIEDSGELGEVDKTVNADSLIDQASTDAIFALSTVGEVTAPLDTENGIMLFILTAKGDAVSDADLAAAKIALQTEKAAPQVVALGDKLNQAVFESGTPSLESIAEATNLHIVQSKALIINGKKDILAVPEVVEAIVNSDKKIGQLAEPVTVGERVILYRLTAVKAPEQRPLSDVRGMIEKAVVADKTDKQLADAADQLIQQTQSDGLEVAATAMNYPQQVFENFNGQVADSKVLDPIAAILIAQQQPLQGNENADKITSPAGDVFVYVTTKVRLGDVQSADNSEAQKQLTATLAEQIGHLELGEFVDSITERAVIKDRSATLLSQ